MLRLKNPFLYFRNDGTDRNHNPYLFNPFTVLELPKEEMDESVIEEIIEDLNWDLDPEKTGVLSDEDNIILTNAKNAQRFLEEPLQRLAFEILIPNQ